jgi:hypothetical protein
MAIPHYAYLVLKMLGPYGVISIRGDIKRAYDSDKESYEMADRLMASTELKKALVESPRTQSCSRSRHPSSWRTHSARRSHCLRRNLPRLLTWAIIWTPNRNSCSSNSSRKIGTSLHGSHLTCRESLGS